MPAIRLGEKEGVGALREMEGGELVVGTELELHERQDDDSASWLETFQTYR